MTHYHLQRSVLFTGIVLLLLAGGVGLWLWAQQRQYALNRQLIAALVRTDDRQALALVKAGADPNTRYQSTSVSSLLDLIKQLFHRSTPPANDSPTALGMACGALWANDDANLRTQQGRPDAPQLVHVMLTHGADVTATMSSGWVEVGTGWTPFMWAVGRFRWDDEGNPNSVAVIRDLLAHGANPNVAYNENNTPLSEVEFIPELRTLLRQYGARK